MGSAFDEQTDRMMSSTDMPIWNENEGNDDRNHGN